MNELGCVRLRVNGRADGAAIGTDLEIQDIRKDVRSVFEDLVVGTHNVGQDDRVLTVDVAQRPGAFGAQLAKATCKRKERDMKTMDIFIIETVLCFASCKYSNLFINGFILILKPRVL